MRKKILYYLLIPLLMVIFTDTQAGMFKKRVHLKNVSSKKISTFWKLCDKLGIDTSVKDASPDLDVNQETTQGIGREYVKWAQIKDETGAVIDEIEPGDNAGNETFWLFDGNVVKSVDEAEYNNAKYVAGTTSGVLLEYNKIVRIKCTRYEDNGYLWAHPDYRVAGTTSPENYYELLVAPGGDARMNSAASFFLLKCAGNPTKTGPVQYNEYLEIYSLATTDVNGKNTSLETRKWIASKPSQWGDAHYEILIVSDKSARFNNNLGTFKIVNALAPNVSGPVIMSAVLPVKIESTTTDFITRPAIWVGDSRTRFGEGYKEILIDDWDKKANRANGRDSFFVFSYPTEPQNIINQINESVQAKLGIYTFVTPNPTDNTDYSKQPAKIAYGDVIRLSTKVGKGVDGKEMSLHSHAINYNATASKNTSGQQQITGYAGEDDNDWWVVLPDNAKSDIKKGTIIKNGDKVSLYHMSTGKWLHSHTDVNLETTNDHDVKLKSPDNENREITCFGYDEVHFGNIWVVELYTNEKPLADGVEWTTDKNIALKRYNPHLGKPEYKTKYPEYVFISDKTFDLGGVAAGQLQNIVCLSKIPSYFYVEDIKNKPGYVHGQFNVEVPLNLPARWDAEAGKFKDVAVGSTTEGKILKYGIGLDDNLYEFNDESMSENPWELVKDINYENKSPIGKLISLTISSDGEMYAITSDNKVIKFDFTKKFWTEIKVPNQPTLTQISCGNKETLVAKSADNKLYKYTGKDWFEISEEGQMVVASLSGRIFGLNSEGKVYKYKGDDNWRDLPAGEEPFIYIAAASTESDVKPPKKVASAVATAIKEPQVFFETTILAIDKSLRLWSLKLKDVKWEHTPDKLDEKAKKELKELHVKMGDKKPPVRPKKDDLKWEPVLGKDGKQACGLTKIALNGPSFAAIDGEGDNYHRGESGVKLTPEKKVVEAKPVTPSPRAVAKDKGTVKKKVVKKKVVLKKKPKTKKAPAKRPTKAQALAKQKADAKKANAPAKKTTKAKAANKATKAKATKAKAAKAKAAKAKAAKAAAKKTAEKTAAAATGAEAA